MTRQQEETAGVPMRAVGPARIVGPVMDEEVTIPLATFETPLWPSVNRGAKISRLIHGVQVVITDERMTRSLLFEAPSGRDAAEAARRLEERSEELAKVSEETSRFARFLDMHIQLVGNLLYLRIEMQTGDAAGHNMVTGAAEHVAGWVLGNFPELSYVSISGNYCTDKKPSAVNGILGRGKHAIAEGVIPVEICRKHLKTDPQKIVDLNTKKNLVGTMLAGGIRSANAHFANMMLGVYLATGQDAANIVEGSQGFTYAAMREDDLYFSVTVPHIIVGTVGAGKDIPFVRENLEKLGCLEKREPGQNARRLAAVVAAAVWCGELSLLAAQTNPGELMKAHRAYERSK